MKVASRILGLLLLLSQPVLGQPGLGQEPTDAPPAAGESAGLAAQVALPAPSEEELHQGLRDLKTAMEEALNSRNIDLILQHVDEQVVFTTMNGDVVTGREGVRAYFDKMMNGPDKVVESVQTSFVPDALSILHGGDTAISWGHTADQYELTTGQSLAIEARWSGTMVRRDGRWLVASFHYSTNMFDNPVLSAQRKLLIGSGIAGAVLLGLVGFLLGRRGRARG